MNDTIEASQLGLPPGYWPNQITHKGWPYKKATVVWEQGEIEAVIYITDGGDLVVLND